MVADLECQYAGFRPSDQVLSELWMIQPHTCDALAVHVLAAAAAAAAAGAAAAAAAAEAAEVARAAIRGPIAL